MKIWVKQEKFFLNSSIKTLVCTLFAVAAVIFLPLNKLAAQIKETKDTTFTSDKFLTHLGVKITDPNEKNLIDTVWWFLIDNRSKQFTEDFFAKQMENMKEFSSEEKNLYLIGVFCDVYMNFTNGQFRVIDGQKLADVISDGMSDELFEATEKGYDEYVEDISNFWKNMSDEADKKIAEYRQQSAEADKRSAEADKKIAEYRQQSDEADKKIAEYRQQSAEYRQQSAEYRQQSAEYRQQSAEADKRSAENLKASEESLRILYAENKNRKISNELLQQLIEIKNSARNFQQTKDSQNKPVYIPSDDVEKIFNWIEQLEQSQKTTPTKK